MKKGVKKKVLVVVAHPDDETLWMGGTLLMHKENEDWDVTIISLCRRDDPDRAPKFKRVCQELGAKRCFISDLEDEKLRDLAPRQIEERLRRFTRRRYDMIFTHGANGEYGHKRHREVHFTVEKMVKKEKLKCDELIFFDYACSKRICRPRARPDKFIKLDAVTFLKKKMLIHDLYGFEKRTLEFKTYCCRIESFKIAK